MSSNRKLRSVKKVEELKAAVDAAVEARGEGVSVPHRTPDDNTGGISVSNRTPGRMFPVEDNIDGVPVSNKTPGRIPEPLLFSVENNTGGVSVSHRSSGRMSEPILFPAEDDLSSGASYQDRDMDVLHLFSRMMSKSTPLEMGAPRLVTASQEAYLTFRNLYRNYKESGGLQKCWDLIDPKIRRAVFIGQRDLTDKTIDGILWEYFIGSHAKSNMIRLLRKLAMPSTLVVQVEEIRAYQIAFMDMYDTTVQQFIKPREAIKIFREGLAPESIRNEIAEDEDFFKMTSELAIFLRECQRVLIHQQERLPKKHYFQKRDIQDAVPREGATAAVAHVNCWNCGEDHHYKSCPYPCIQCGNSKKKHPFAFECKTPDKVRDIIIDSGTSTTFSHQLHYLDNIRGNPQSSHVRTATGEQIEIKCKGQLQGIAAMGVPEFTNTLVSVSQMATDYHSISIFDATGMMNIVQSSEIDVKINQIKEIALKDNLVNFTATLQDGLYRTSWGDFKKSGNRNVSMDEFKGIESDHIAALATYKTMQFRTLGELVQFFHEAWGHMNMANMLRIVKYQLFAKIPKELTEPVIRKHFPVICARCTNASLSRIPLPQQSLTPIDEIGEVIEIDIKGPWTDAKGKVCPTFSNCKYAMTAIDVASEYTWGLLLPSRKNLLTAFKYVVRQFRYQHPDKPIKVIRVDQELVTHAIQEFCDNYVPRIVLQQTAPHEHGQLGHIERFFREVKERVIKEMTEKPHITDQYWGMAYNDALFKHNLSPHSVKQVTRYSLWHGEIIDLKNVPILPFGTIIKAHIPLEDQTRGHAGRSIDTVYVGPALKVKGALALFNPETKRYLIRRSFKSMGSHPPLSPIYELPVEYEAMDDEYSEVVQSPMEIPLQKNEEVDVTLQKNEEVAISNIQDATDLDDSNRTEGDSNRTEGVIQQLTSIDPSSDLNVISSERIEPIKLHTPRLVVSKKNRDKTKLKIRSNRARKIRDNSKYENCSFAEWCEIIDAFHAQAAYACDVPIIQVEKRGRSPRCNSPYQVYLSDQGTGSQGKIPIPRNIREALQGQYGSHWQKALEVELESFARNQCILPVDEEVKQIPEEKIWDSQVLMDVVYNPDGSFKKFKIRIVLNGKGMQNVYDWDNYAGTVKAESVKIVLATTAELDWELESYDVKTAFLIPHLPPGSEVYMRRPRGLSDKHMPAIVQVNKAMYGMPLASKAFRDHSDDALRDIGFKPTCSDPQVYVMKTEIGQAIICTHVDDFGVATSNVAMKKYVREALQSKYDLTVNETMNYYLGMHIERDRQKRSITVTQPAYVEAMLETFQIEDAGDKFPQTPLPVDHIPFHSSTLPVFGEEDLEKVIREHAQQLGPYKKEKKLFQAMIGSLLYLAISTRPDILFAVNYLSRYNQNPSKSHIELARRIMAYVAGTRHLGLVFHSGEGIKLYATVDASYACHTDLKSHTGVTLHIGKNSGSVFSLTQKQSITADSSTVAEFIGCHLAAKQILWARNLLEELGFPQDLPTTMFEDNKSTIVLLNREYNCSKTKHIQLRYNFIREHIKENRIRVEYLASEDMISDMLTKNLLPTTFLHLRTKLLGMN